MSGQAANRHAPGAPGQDAHWASAAKNGFGTSHTIASKVWFTLNNGVMTEVFYPRLDMPNSQTLQLIVCHQRGCPCRRNFFLPSRGLCYYSRDSGSGLSSLIRALVIALLDRNRISAKRRAGEYLSSP